jgi:flagellar biosynthesis regulator FlbT
VLPAHAECRLRLRLPAGEHLVRVLVGGTVVAADRAGTIELGDRHGAVELHATIT